ncbi:MAG: hypothetical protein IEMM0002_0944 [bacterium]|nr:MAG: hypothetical protein IEMM0002_0944 [bacterium]
MNIYKSLEFKITAIIISIFVLIGLLAIYAQYASLKNTEAEKHKENLVKFEQAIAIAVQNYVETTQVHFYNIVVKDRDLKKAILSGDEYAVEDNSVPDYNRLKVEVSELEAMAIYLPNATVLRREHSDKKGDRTYSPIVLSAIRKNMFLSGIEEENGKYLFYIVSPLTYKGKSVGYAEAGMNLDAVTELIKKFTHINNVSIVFERDSHPLRIEKSDDEKINAIYQIPINNFSGKKAGHVQFVRDITAETRRAQRKVWVQVLSVAILAICLGLFLVWVINRMVVKPIQVLVDATREVQWEADNVHLDESRQDEFGLLSRFFNKMLSRLYAYKDWSEVQKNLLEKARDEAQQATKAKSVFLANMSHELRTPLNAIIGYSEMMQEEAEDSGNKDMVPDLMRINMAGKHLLELIKDVLDLSKIEAGRMDLYLENFDVPQLIREISDTIAPLTEENKNTLSFSCAADVGLMRADVTKVRQTLFNLLSNACKFTKNGFIHIGVARTNTDGTDWINISVSDTGVGINQRQLDKIFEAFSQADSSTTRDFGGTGLGLTISLRFCELMGGDITVESTPGKGSTFTVRLPASVRKPDVPNAESARLLKGPDKTPIDNRRKKISQVLVIDDDPAIQDMLKRFLSKEGFLTNTASDGEEGLQRIEENRPDMIILDVMMPGMDGWAVLKALKANPGLAGIPVIILSVLNDMSMGYALGAADYMTKPIDWDHMLRSIKEFSRKTAKNQVLVVEPDNGALTQAKGMMEAEGFSVMEAKDGREALKRTAENVPSLILLNLETPQADNFEFVMELRRTREWRSIPIIVVSGSNISAKDKEKLDGNVEYLSQTRNGMYTRDELLNELKEIILENIRTKQEHGQNIQNSHR